MDDKNRKITYKLGIALSGGGARGFAHAGAFKAIDDAGFKPDIIAGTSAGALVGALYSDGYHPQEIANLFIGSEFKKFVEWQVPKTAIFNMSGFQKFLKKHLRAKTFEELSIPLKVVATNLDEGFFTVFEKGNLIEPLMASCSIPVVFNPIKINGINYVDGGLFKNFPVSVIRENCKTVIGINVSPLVSKKHNDSIVNIAELTYHYMFRANTLQDRRLCDILIETKDVAEYKTFDLENVTKIFELGYQTALETINNIPEKKNLFQKIFQ